MGNYSIGATLGEGTFGKVRRGQHDATGETVAIKILEKSKIVEAADIERVMREIKILKRVKHENVIQLYEVIDTPQQIYLVMEYLNGGELFDYIVRKQRLSEPNACFMFHQLIDATAYLHGVNVIHRDLKPENLLMHRTRHGWLLKVADFGLGNTNDGDVLLKTACGSPCYAAPEMIAGHAYRGNLTDMWSMGVILFALVAGYLPFEDQDTGMLYKKILNAQYQLPHWISQPCRDLIKRILVTDPRSRIDAEGVRSHLWYNSFNDSHNMLKTIHAVRSISGSACDEPDISAMVIQQMTDMGYEEGLIRANVEDRAHNVVTATYNILNRKVRERRDMLNSLRDPSKMPRLNVAKTAEADISVPSTARAPATGGDKIKAEMPLSARASSVSAVTSSSSKKETPGQAVEVLRVEKVPDANEEASTVLPQRPPSHEKNHAASASYSERPGRALLEASSSHPRKVPDKEVQQLSSLAPEKIAAEVKRVLALNKFEWATDSGNAYTIEAVRSNVKFIFEIVLPTSSSSTANHGILIRSFSGCEATARRISQQIFSEMKL